MQIKDLIAKLETLYNTYDDSYKNVMGEPEIMIDVFKLVPNTNHTAYAGFSKEINIDKSGDGVYDILSAFHEDYHKDQETQELPGSNLPWPQSWET